MNARQLIKFYEPSIIVTATQNYIQENIVKAPFDKDMRVVLHAMQPLVDHVYRASSTSGVTRRPLKEIGQALRLLLDAIDEHALLPQTMLISQLKVLREELKMLNFALEALEKLTRDNDYNLMYGLPAAYMLGDCLDNILLLTEVV